MYICCRGHACFHWQCRWQYFPWFLSFLILGLTILMSSNSSLLWHVPEQKMLFLSERNLYIVVHISYLKIGCRVEYLYNAVRVHPNFDSMDPTYRPGWARYGVLVFNAKAWFTIEWHRDIIWTILNTFKGEICIITSVHKFGTSQLCLGDSQRDVIC